MLFFILVGEALFVVHTGINNACFCLAMRLQACTIHHWIWFDEHMICDVCSHSMTSRPVLHCQICLYAMGEQSNINIFFFC